MGLFSNQAKKIAEGKRLYYYSMRFFDVPNKNGEAEMISTEVIASDRDEAEQFAREAMGKDAKPLCRVESIVELSAKAILGLKDELTEAIRIA